MRRKLLGDIITLTCIIFAPLTFLLSLLCSIISGPQMLPHFGVVAVFLVILFLISSIFVVMKNNRIKIVSNKKNPYTISSILFSVLSFVINMIAWFINSEESGKLWNIYTIITIISFSVVFSFAVLYIKKFKLFVKAIIYLAITAVPYFIILVLISGFFTGTRIFIPLSIYAVIYIGVLIFFGVKELKRREKELNEKPYESQFN
ncbi:MAG: hypothetical protein IJW19_07200 [Clostridia bacterium]|nr:hypothetical protein [Clostridia bacterium]